MRKFFTLCAVVIAIGGVSAFVRAAGYGGDPNRLDLFALGVAFVCLAFHVVVANLDGMSEPTRKPHGGEWWCPRCRCWYPLDTDHAVNGSKHHKHGKISGRGMWAE